jgi:hypothetical protein
MASCDVLVVLILGAKKSGLPSEQCVNVVDVWVELA